MSEFNSKFHKNALTDQLDDSLIRTGVRAHFRIEELFRDYM